MEKSYRIAYFNQREDINMHKHFEPLLNSPSGPLFAIGVLLSKRRHQHAEPSLVPDPSMYKRMREMK